MFRGQIEEKSWREYLKDSNPNKRENDEYDDGIEILKEQAKNRMIVEFPMIFQKTFAIKLKESQHYGIIFFQA